MPSPAKTNSFAELLRRCDFDWAEDVEDAVINSNLSMAATPKSLGYSLPEAKLYNKIHLGPRHITRPKYNPSLSTIHEEVWNEPWGWAHGTPDTASEEIGTELHETTSRSSNYEIPLPRDEFRREQLTPNVESEAYLVAQTYVDNIFSDRQSWIEADEDIHHFNWMGLRAYTHSSTSPGDSLAIILADTKHPGGSPTWRIRALLNRAVDYIDPVLVLLDGTNDSLFELRGSALVRASTGRVFKFYSPHGRWLEDPSDTSEETTTDFGNVRTYDAADLAIGNGFVESSAIRSVSQWTESLHEACDTSGGLSRLPRRMTWERKPSPLSQCESIHAEITPQAPQPKTIERPKKPPRKITTCVVGEPTEEYFSFPTPVFGRRRAINQAFEKARQGLASMLTSVKRKFR
ncbi:unnamed protein product [Penicillium glandicola]